jgi:hypothetical protein
MTALPYPSFRQPQGDTIRVLDHFEERRFSSGSFNGKHIVTGGHNRPVICEAAGDGEIESHLMGIKPPLLAPAVSVASGGVVTCDLQIAVQRCYMGGGLENAVYSDVSPVWPNAADFFEPQKRNWSSLAGKPIFWLGRSDKKAVKHAFTLSSLIAQTKTYLPFAGGAETSFSSLLIDSIRFYGYIPSWSDGSSLSVAIFSGTEGSLVQVSPWAVVNIDAIPRGVDAGAEVGDPAIVARFQNAVALRAADGDNYHIVIKIDDYTKAVAVVVDTTTSSGSGAMKHTTGATPSSATWAAFTTSNWYTEKNNQIDSVYRESNGDVAITVSPVELCDMKAPFSASAAGTLFTAIAAHWDYRSGVMVGLSEPLRIKAVKVDGFTGKIEAANTLASNSYPGWGHSKLCIDPTDNLVLYVASEVLAGGTRKVYVHRITHTVDSGSGGAELLAGTPEEVYASDVDLGVLAASESSNYIFAFVPIVTGGAFLVIKEVTDSRIRVVKFASDFETYTEGTYTGGQYITDADSDPNDADLLYLAWHNAGGGGVYSLDLTSGGTLSASLIMAHDGDDRWQCVATDKNTSPTNLYVGGYTNGRLRKYVAGDTYSNVGQITGGSFRTLAVSKEDENYLHAAVVVSGEPKTYYSANAGVTWAKMTDGRADLLMDTAVNYVGESTTVDNMKPLLLTGTGNEKIAHYATKASVTSSVFPRDPARLLVRMVPKLLFGTGSLNVQIGNEPAAPAGLAALVAGGATSVRAANQYSYTTYSGRNYFYPSDYYLNDAEDDDRFSVSYTPSGGGATVFTSMTARQLKAGGSETIKYYRQSDITRVSVSAGIELHSGVFVSQTSANGYLALSISRKPVLRTSEELYWAASGSKITVNTATMHSREPESEDQGGTERYDSFAILVRDKARGAQFYRVATVNAGDSFTINEPSETLIAKGIPVVAGIIETPGGFEQVVVHRQSGTERLCFIGQPGYDSAHGIPGAKDYKYRYDEPQVVTAGSGHYLVRQQLGRVSAINLTTRVITLANYDEDALTALAVGDQLPYLSDAGFGGFLIVSAKDANAGTVTYSALSYSTPSVQSTLYQPFNQTEGGTVSAVISEVTDGVGYHTLTLDGDNARDFLTFLIAGEYVQVGNGFFKVISASPSTLALTVETTTFSSVTAIAEDASVKQWHGDLYFAHQTSISLFRGRDNEEVCRAWLQKDSGNGMLALYSDHGSYNASNVYVKSSPGVQGAQPINISAVELRTAAFGAVKKGDTRIHVFPAIANDYWHQRAVTFEGDPYKAYIKKVVKYDTDTGALLREPQLELFEPWGGEDHLFVPIQVLSDHSSVYLTGNSSEPEHFETVSDFTRLELLPKTGLRAIVPAKGNVYAFAESDEIFTMSPSNFVLPSTGEEFIAFEIAAEVAVDRATSNFTIPSNGYAIDGEGVIYLVGHHGLYVTSPPGIRAIDGKRDWFSKYDTNTVRGARLVWDEGHWPLPVIRVVGLGFDEDGNTEQLAFCPDTKQWLNFGGQANIDTATVGNKASGEPTVVFGGSGTIGLLAQHNPEEDFAPEYDGEDAGVNAYANGQAQTANTSGFIGTADISTFDAEAGILALDVTYQDSTAASPEALDLSGFGTMLNCPVDANNEAVNVAWRGVKMVKINTSTGVAEEAKIIALHREYDQANAVYVNTLYVKPDSAWTDTAGAKYHWMIGPRYFRVTSNEVTPDRKHRGVQLTGVAFDIEPTGTDTYPWWVKMEVFGNGTNGPIDYSTAQITRIIPWTRFRNGAARDITIRGRVNRGLVVRLSGYSPANADIRIRQFDLHVDDVVGA